MNVEEYRYDYAGNRIAKIGELSTTYYLVDTNGALSQVLAEYDENGSLKTYYTRGDELISQERGSEKHYYLYDGFDSVRMLTDDEGSVTDTYTFDAFGNLTDSTGDTENSYLYRGEQFDSFTGLYYLRARYMNPSTGTFITMDEYAGSVFEPVSLHKYLYANANPVNNSDPSGYSTLADNQVAVAGVAILAATVVCTCGFKILDALNMTISSSSIFDDQDILDWSEGIVSGAVTSPNIVNDIRDNSDSEAEPGTGAGSSNTNSPSPKKPKKSKKPRNYKHLTLEEILKRFNLNQDEWHRIIKPGILSWLRKNIGSFSEDAQKAYKQLERNPDFYFSSDGFIQLVGVRFKKAIELGVDMYYFIEELLHR